jgi:hypothetical protein
MAAAVAEIKPLQESLNEKPTPPPAAELPATLPLACSSCFVSLGTTAFSNMSDFSSLGEQSSDSSMNEDYQAWLLHQAAALRARRYHSLDVEHLAEELEDMAVLRREELRNRLRLVLHHMLKLACERRATDIQWRHRQWKLQLTEHRHCVNDLLESSGTLRAQFPDMIPGAYEKARELAGLDIDPNEAPVGPTRCPWTIDQILNTNFFPTSD